MPSAPERPRWTLWPALFLYPIVENYAACPLRGRLTDFVFRRWAESLSAHPWLRGLWDALIDDSVEAATIAGIAFALVRFYRLPASSLKPRWDKRSALRGLGAACALCGLTGLLGTARWLLLSVDVDMFFPPQPVAAHDLSMFILIAPLEELLFRAGLLQACRRHFGDGAAVLVSSLAFAFPHYMGRDAHMAIRAVLPGVALSWLYLRTGSLSAAIIAHCLDDFLLCAVGTGAFNQIALLAVGALILRGQETAATAERARLDRVLARVSAGVCVLTVAALVFLDRG
jgi:membrane protease YdiL (CAAX protease family)